MLFMATINNYDKLFQSQKISTSTVNKQPHGTPEGGHRGGGLCVDCFYYFSCIRV